MDEPLAVALKFGFLVVLYLFLLWVVRSSMRDLARYGGSAAAEPVETPSPARRKRSSQSRQQGGAPRGGPVRLVVACAHRRPRWRAMARGHGVDQRHPSQRPPGQDGPAPFH